MSKKCTKIAQNSLLPSFLHTKKGLGIFKSFNNCGVFVEYKDVRNFNEVLCYELAKQIGVETAVYEPAHIDFKKGVITYNVCGPDEDLENCLTYFNYKAKYSIKSILKGLDDKKVNYDKKKMFLDLYKLLVFDTLTFQEDRHNSNIHFLINRQDKSVKLSPIIDNEFAFGLKIIGELNEIMDEGSLYLYRDKFIEFHGNGVLFFAGQEDYKVPIAKRYQHNIKKIIMIAKNNDACKEFLNNALQNLDIVTALEKMKDYGYKLTDDYKNYLIDLIGLSKELFEENIQTLSNNKKVENLLDEKQDFIKK